MAGIIENPDIPLPSHFMEGEINKENFLNECIPHKPLDAMIFPVDFPYCIDDTFGDSSPMFNSPLESVQRGGEGQEFYITELSHFLARSSLGETSKFGSPEEAWHLSGSRPSMLIPMVWSQKSYPPLNAFTDTCGVMCTAARQVAMDGSDRPIMHSNSYKPTYCCSGRHSPQFMDKLGQSYAMKCLASETELLSQRRQEILKKRMLLLSSSMPGSENGRCGCALGLPDFAWPSLQQLDGQRNRSVLESGFHNAFPGRNKQSAGTGVFLPRGYSSVSDSCKNQDARIARRNGILIEQQQQNRILFEDRVVDSEIRLPQEWTY